MWPDDHLELLHQENVLYINGDFVWLTDASAHDHKSRWFNLRVHDNEATQEFTHIWLQKIS